MNGTMKDARVAKWGKVTFRWFVTGAALVWANSSLAEDAQPAGTTTTAATAAATSSVTMASDGLPLLIPDGVWKRLTTLTADQKAQLTALQTGLYSDQLTTINSITNQPQTLRTALVAAGNAVQSDAVKALQGQIIDLAGPLLQRYDKFVKQAIALLQPAQQAELTTVANQIVADKRLTVTAIQTGLVDAYPIAPAILSKLGPVELMDADEDDDKDALPTLWELQHGLNPLDSSDTGMDTDGDGLVNYVEYLLNTDPQNPDDPGSGLSVDWRTKLGLRCAANKDGSKSQTTGSGSTLHALSGEGLISTNALSATSTEGKTISVQIISPATGTVVK